MLVQHVQVNWTELERLSIMMQMMILYVMLSRLLVVLGDVSCQVLRSEKEHHAHHSFGFE